MIKQRKKQGNAVGQTETHTEGRKSKRTSFFKRRCITKLEWKGMYAFKSYILPFLFIGTLMGIILGNRDSLFILTGGLLSILLVFVYTKRKVPRNKKKITIPKWVCISAEIIILIISMLHLYDLARYNYATAQVQFQNEGYTRLVVVGKENFGNSSWKVLEHNQVNNKIYQHVFEGNKYLSRVDVTNRLMEEAKGESSY